MSYNIYPVELNRGSSSYTKTGHYVGGTNTFTVVIDATQVQIKVKNPILTINKPLSNSNQVASYNASSSFTAVGNQITLNAGTWNSNIKPGDVIKFTADTSTEYTILSKPSTTIAYVSPPSPPTTGTLTAYKGVVTWLMNMKRITETVSINGFLMNDYVHHSGLGTKKYAEEKLNILFDIIGLGANTSSTFNCILRENDMLPGRYFGQVLCTDLTITDTAGKKGTEPTRNVSGTGRVDKIPISMTLIKGIPK